MSSGTTTDRHLPEEIWPCAAVTTKQNKHKIADMKRSYLTPLLLACKAGHESVVEALIGAGADVNGIPVLEHPIFNRRMRRKHDVYVGASALACAVEHGHAHIVRRLLAAGARVERAIHRDSDESPLSIAALLGNIELVSMLLASMVVPSSSTTCEEPKLSSKDLNEHHYSTPSPSPSPQEQAYASFCSRSDSALRERLYHKALHRAWTGGNKEIVDAIMNAYVAARCANF